MKTNLPKYILGFTAAFMAIVSTGCKDELSLNLEFPDASTEESGDTYYLAVRIYNAASIDGETRSTRDAALDKDPTFDSSGNDYTGADNNKYNIGLKSENAIYPKGTSTDSPNYLLVFGEADTEEDALNSTLEYLLPLNDWEYEKNGKSEVDNTNSTTESPNATPGYDSYNTFYTSGKKYMLPENFDKRKVLVVVNASTALQTQLKNALTSMMKYSEVLQMKVQKGEGETDPSEYLYYHTSDGDYLTMSSSMVIPTQEMSSLKTGWSMMTPVGSYGPAGIKRPYVWKPTKKEAADAPVFSFFLERMQAKYTLTFLDSSGKKHYFTTKKDAVEKDGYVPESQKYIVSPDLSQMNPEWRTIKYVERYDRRNDEDKYGDDHVKQFINTANSIKINFLGWSFNGVEREEYLFKQISKADGDNDKYYDGWNNSSYSPYRNFWSVDANYSSTEYPDQFRGAKEIVTGKNTDDNKPGTAVDWFGGWADVVEDDHVTAWAESMATEANYVDYFNFNSMRKWATHHYAPENTYNMSVFEKEKYQDENDAFAHRAHMRAGTHIIIGAQLLIEGMERGNIYTNPKIDETTHMATSSDGSNYSVRDKYYMNGIFWSDVAYRTYVSEYLGYWMMKDEATFGPNDGIFYVTPEDDRSAATVAGEGKFFIEPLKIEGSDGWSHIVPNTAELWEGEDLSGFTEEELDQKTVFYSYDPETNRYKPISRKTFEILALSHPEYFAQHFNNGRMYYAIPVDHFIDSSNEKALYTGRHASVRNHWYNFTVSKIKSLGEPVDDPVNDLIIPSIDHSYESLGITLSVLPWHVEDVNVDISGQRQPSNPDLIDLDIRIKAEDWIYEGSEYED